VTPAGTWKLTVCDVVNSTGSVDPRQVAAAAGDARLSMMTGAVHAAPPTMAARFRTSRRVDARFTVSSSAGMGWHYKCL
jgi:hypothetical protein